MPRNLLNLFLLGVIPMLLMSCGATKPAKETAGEAPVAQLPQPPVYVPGDIIDTRSGGKVGFDDLVRDISDARIVYVGETHVAPDDHRIQMKVLEALHGRNPSLVLAMEMFPKPVQPIVNRWTAGQMPDEKAFVAKVRWKDIWGYPFDLYRDILVFARDRHIGILAINAPSSVVRNIARKGFKSLAPKERSQLARDFDFNDAGHREYVRKNYEEHMKGIIKNFESFYTAQLAWEETMAETLADALASRGQSGEQILALIGKGHLSYRFGVPRRVERRVAHEYKTIIPVPADVVETPVDPQLADYIWVTEKMQLPDDPHKGRFGIIIGQNSSGAGLTVSQVLPDTPAQKAGIRNGDVITAIDDIAIQSIGDIHRAMSAGGPTHRIRLRRDGSEVSIEVTLPQRRSRSSR